MDGKVNMNDLITHKMPLEDINKAFDLMHEGKAFVQLLSFNFLLKPLISL